MPWLETVPMEERLRFVHDAFSDRFTMSELCARYGVSRRIGYKWLERFEAEGRPGLKDRSRAPHHCPHRIAPADRQYVGRGPSSPSALGCPETRRHPRPPTSGDPHVARPEYRGRSLGPPRPCTASTPTAAPGASRGRPAGHRGAQRPLDRGLQGRVPHGRWAVLLSADHRRSPCALPAHLSRPALHEDRHGAPCL